MAPISAADDRAFERLYRRHVRDVYRFALALLRNPAEAEDVTQTTFLNAYRALKAGEQPRRPQSWLLTIAHNTARSRARRTLRRPREVPLDDVVSQLTVPESERTNMRELTRALRRLPFNQRTALTMRELEGRSYPEIAETLGVTVPAVEALLARARRTLRLQAAAIRGFALVGLPRSLRRLWEHGETTAGGAIGAGTVAKAAAVVAAGLAAGGLGFVAGEAGSDAAPAGRQPTPVVAAVAVEPAHHARRARPATAAPAPTTTRRDRTTAPAGAQSSARPVHDAAGASLPSGSPAPAAPGPAAAPAASPAAPKSAPTSTPTSTEAGAPTPVRDAVTTTTATVATLPAVPALPPVTVETPPLPTVPALPPPPVPVPTVPIPTVPAPPPVPETPTIPQPPSLP
jgi:RNA polymerase sigma factor (sigma-70 family)